MFKMCWGKESTENYCNKNNITGDDRIKYIISQITHDDIVNLSEFIGILPNEFIYKNKSYILINDKFYSEGKPVPFNILEL